MQVICAFPRGPALVHAQGHTLFNLYSLHVSRTLLIFIVCIIKGSFRSSAQPGSSNQEAHVLHAGNTHHRRL